LAAALACVLAAVAVAACGSSNDSSSSDTSSSSGASSSASTSTSSGTTSSGPFVTPDVTAALKQITGLEPLSAPATKDELAQRVASYEKTPTKLLQDQPVSKKATAGKNIALLVCGVPVCSEFNKAANEAADLLGWKVTRIDLGVSPEDFTNAYNRAVQLKPDLVVGSGLPRELFAKQLDQLQEMNIPVIEWSSGIKPVPGHLWTATDDPLYKARGIQIAEWIANDGNLAGDTAIFSVKQYTMSELAGHTIQNYLPKICPNCKTDYQYANAADIGKLAPKVTAYVQRRPNTKYVFCTFGDLCQGVGQALKTAGSKAKVVTEDGGTTNYQNMANGLEAATSPLPIGQTGWQIIDLAQRIFNGDDTSKTRLEPMQIVTEVSDPKSPLIGAVPDYQQQYKALWQVG
jgi:ribose transport system substrate-binding protein